MSQKVSTFHKIGFVIFLISGVIGVAIRLSIEPEYSHGVYVVDDDGDGFGTLLDCNDADANINPSMREECGDGIDNDCDPTNDC